MERERREQEKEKARLEKAQAREAKKKEKELDKALRSVAKEGNKDNSPAHRLRQIVVVLDSTLSENRDFMSFFATALRSLGVEYRLSTCGEPGVVRWKRLVTERDVSESAKVVQQVVEVEEKEMLLTLEAQGFVGLVHHSKQVCFEATIISRYKMTAIYLNSFCSRGLGTLI